VRRIISAMLRTTASGPTRRGCNSCRRKNAKGRVCQLFGSVERLPQHPRLTDIRQNCGLDRYWRGFGPQSGAYDERGAAGGFDDLVCDDGQFVGLCDPFHLREKPVQEPEVAAGDARD
jgi:hypothetical protein